MNGASPERVMGYARIEKKEKETYGKAQNL